MDSVPLLPPPPPKKKKKKKKKKISNVTIRAISDKNRSELGQIFGQDVCAPPEWTGPIWLYAAYGPYEYHNNVEHWLCCIYSRRNINWHHRYRCFTKGQNCITSYLSFNWNQIFIIIFILYNIISGDARGIGACIFQLVLVKNIKKAKETKKSQLFHPTGQNNTTKVQK